MPKLQMTSTGRTVTGALAVALALVSVTLVATTSLHSYDLFVYNDMLLAMVGAVALNMLMGTAGQLSIGNAAFLAVGAFATAIFENWGLPAAPSIVCAAIFSAVLGLLFGLPALRIVGIYLVLATLAAHFIVLYACNWYQNKRNAVAGIEVSAFFGSANLDDQQKSWAWFLTVVVVAVILLILALTTGRAGRAWRMVRDHEPAAALLGIEVRRYKLTAFVISSGLIGLEGALSAHLIGSVSVDLFTLDLAISYVAMIIIGGLDSIPGALIGAAVVSWLPTVIPSVVSRVGGDSQTIELHAPQISQVVYGALIILFVTLSPGGIAGWCRTLTGLLVRRWRTDRADEATPRPSSVVPTAPSGGHARQEVPSDTASTAR